MDFIKFNGINVRYFTYRDHRLYFTANSVFNAIGYIGWSNYMQRHPKDFILPQKSKDGRQCIASISWEGLKRFPDNCKKDSTRMYNWWTDHHSMYFGFMNYARQNIPGLVPPKNDKPSEAQPQAKPQTQVVQPKTTPQAQPQAKPVDLTCPEHTHPATVAALRSLHKAKLPEPEPKPAPVPLTLDDYCAQVKPIPMETAVRDVAILDARKYAQEKANPVQQLFNKVTATLNRHKGGEDSFPRIRDYWNEATEEVVALKMALLKIARIENGISVEDSYVDAIGYLALAYNKYKEQQNA